MGQAVPPPAVLIVEDEALIRHDLMDFFEDRGFRVFEATDADEAIAILKDNPSIQTVLTDIQMKGSMDGLKLARYVRDRYPPVSVIVVSGVVRPDPGELPDRALFLSKPFDPWSVLREIERLRR